MKQGKWLVQEIDKAIKSAPQDCGGDEDQRKHWANRAKRAQGAISKICKDWPNQILHPEEYKAYWQKNNPRIRRLTRYVLQSRHKQLEAHGCITIQAPDGPEYTLINTKDALRELKKRVALKYIENDAPPLNPTGYLPKQRKPRTRPRHASWYHCSLWMRRRHWRGSILSDHIRIAARRGKSSPRTGGRWAAYWDTLTGSSIRCTRFRKRSTKTTSITTPGEQRKFPTQIPAGSPPAIVRRRPPM